MSNDESGIESHAISLYAELIANFTHQIINPLNGVVGTLDNLIDGTISVARRDQRIRAASAQLCNTIELVRNLAHLSRLTTAAGRDSLKDLGKRSVIPQVVIQSAMFFQELGADKNMKINLEDDQTQYSVRGDPDLLRQVFTNLFDNAVKYGDSDSLVSVVAHGQTHTGNLIVEVTNLGPGFGFDEKESIFLRGMRGRAAKQVKASGSGIGLYICRELLDAGFGASIEAEHSQKQLKTTFRIRFPTYSIESSEERMDG